MVSIYVKEGCVTDISFDELHFRANYHIGRLSEKQLKEACPFKISDYLRITFDEAKGCFELKGDPYAISTMMGMDIYYKERYSVQPVAVDWSAVALCLMQAKVPEEKINQIVSSANLEEALRLIN